MFVKKDKPLRNIHLHMLKVVLEYIYWRTSIFLSILGVKYKSKKGGPLENFGYRNQAPEKVVSIKVDKEDEMSSRAVFSNLERR